MIKIYQIQLSNDQIDLINEKGHDAVPANMAKMSATFGRFKSSFFEFYTEAYEVETDDLNKAFEWTNLWNNQERVDVLGDHGHSSSVGDLFELDGEFFVCADVGFEKVEIECQL